MSTLLGERKTRLIIILLNQIDFAAYMYLN